MLRHDFSSALLHGAAGAFSLALVVPPLATAGDLAGVSERRSKWGGMVRFLSGCDEAAIAALQRTCSLGVHLSVSAAAVAVSVALAVGITVVAIVAAGGGGGDGDGGVICGTVQADAILVTSYW